jgi:hypothetical protein
MRRGLITIGLCAAFWTQATFAGQTCEEKPVNPQRIMQGFELAHKVKQQLDDSKAELAIIARAGQDLTKYHLRYSHLGIVRKDEDGRWIVMHELNQCGTANSDLFNEGLANFFMDDPYRFASLLLIPAADLQTRILKTLNSPSPRQLHEAHYNMVSYPYSTRYQNSNQWALEILAAALANDVVIQQREQAQAWLAVMAYQPSTLEISMLNRLGGRMFRANIAFDDHPMGKRMAGKIDTVTVESIDQFLQQRDAQLRRITVTYP